MWTNRIANKSSHEIQKNLLLRFVATTMYCNKFLLKALIKIVFTYTVFVFSFRS